jgi:hypothetical protein
MPRGEAVITQINGKAHIMVSDKNPDIRTVRGKAARWLVSVMQFRLTGNYGKGRDEVNKDTILATHEENQHHR